MKVLLLAGGWSSEREVSLRGAAMIAEALQGKGHSVTMLDPSRDFDQVLSAARAHDVAFINMHGSPGEDGLFQALLDKAGCPYQGADPAGSFLALHKAAAKLLFREAGIPLPGGVFLPRHPGPDWNPEDLGLSYPLFVKANTGGSSLLLSRVHTRAELEAALNALFAAGEEALVEQGIKGRDVTCGVLDGKALDPILIVNREGAFFDYYNKYAADGAREICPAPLPEPILARIRDYAERAHKALGLRGCSRADFILEEGENGEDTENLYLLEVNTIPGMTAASLVPKEAAAIGMSYADLVERLLELALDARR